jgi:hypothetical protein
MYIKSACDECFPCLLEKVSSLESRAAKDEGSRRCYKDQAGRVPTRSGHALCTPCYVCS